MGSDTREKGGPRKATDPEISISLQSDWTKRDRQVGLPPGLFGSPHCGMSPSPSPELNVICCILR